MGELEGDETEDRMHHAPIVVSDDRGTPVEVTTDPLPPDDVLNDDDHITPIDGFPHCDPSSVVDDPPPPGDEDDRGLKPRSTPHTTRQRSRKRQRRKVPSSRADENTRLRNLMEEDVHVE